MFQISAESIGVAHREAVKKICSVGVPDITEDGEHVVKLEEPLCIHVSNPLHGYNKHVKSPYGISFDKEYIKKVLEVTEKNFDGNDAVYTYGTRFRDYLKPRVLEKIGTELTYALVGDGDVRGWSVPQGLDQLETCINKLAKNPNTRRAIMVTWIPWKDHGSNEPPCIVVVDFKIIQGDVLTVVGYIRSNDILMGWGENAIGLTAVQQYVADELNLRIGYLETISRDAHVYFKRDQNYLRDMGIMYDI